MVGRFLAAHAEPWGSMFEVQPVGASLGRIGFASSLYRFTDSCLTSLEGAVLLHAGLINVEAALVA